MTHDFTDKVVLVSGSAAGIGKAVALAFARAGAHVVLADLDAQRGAETAASIEAMGRTAYFHTTDMTSERDVDRLFDWVEQRFGRLDCAHNNVGFGWGAGLVGSSLEDWNKTIATCLTSPFLALRREIALMQRGAGGAIVNTASMAGIRYTAVASAAYSAAKAGVISLTRYAAVAHAGDGIRVNSVSPGLVSTEAVAQFLTPQQQIEFASAEQPIGHPIEPAQIADSVLWLCSDSAAMVTGENICVAGGHQAI